MKRVILTAVWLIAVAALAMMCGTSKVNAVECENRYATIVNPIRDRSLWISRDLNWVEIQYKPIAKNRLAATWLLQYDTMKDDELMDQLKKFDANQEMGLFLEISEKLAGDAMVYYTVNRPWYSPEVVFLSGYQRDERERLIDKVFLTFKEEFGYWPKSVGAWWIDSYSMGYMKEKYGIEATMIVADQKTTDNYGIWGQWWGAPYWPAKYNVIKPAENIEEKEEVVVIQWALRDPVLAYEGQGPQFSNYSLQANDYTERGLDLEYFKKLSNTYLDCRNKVGQITVGLEVGMEGARLADEYERQIDYLAGTNTQAISMSNFAKEFGEIFPELNETTYIDNWELSIAARKNDKLSENIVYKKVAFGDYFAEDNNTFLDRKLPVEYGATNYFPMWIFIWLISGVGAILIKDIRWWISGSVFLAAGWWWLLKSRVELGWLVAYGPSPKSDLIWWQMGVVAIVMFAVFLVRKRRSFLTWIPLGFGFLPLVKLVRASIIEGEYWVGLMTGFSNFFGLGISKERFIRLVSVELASHQAESLLKIKLIDTWVVALVVIPLLMVATAIAIKYLARKNKKLKLLAQIILAGMLVWYLYQTAVSVPVSASLL